MKNIVLGILAHVDAGKTTLSESILYNTGVSKRMGRVDNHDTVLDHDAFERSRGITIFSKQARFFLQGYNVSLLDTPGHVDFSAEMERTLQVLDYAIVVISASDGVTGHTKTLWNLLRQYEIPAFIFVNKMDQPGSDRDAVLNQLQKELSDGCVCFADISGENVEHCYEDISILSQDEAILEQYLECGAIDDEKIKACIANRRIFPCYFGSALKNQGVDTLLHGLEKWMRAKEYNPEFGAKIYKITRDDNGNRLTHLKVTGGTLSVKDCIFKDEKVHQIRIYHGEKYETCQTVDAGAICAVTGLINTYAGQGLGIEQDTGMKLYTPIMTYRLLLPKDVSARQIYPNMKQLVEEMPELSLEWNENTEMIHVSLMGQVQTEILTELIKRRFGFALDFDMGSITYMETIKAPVIGVGHFEPLRHYAEVHLLLEPQDAGSGIVVDSNCSVDVLDKNWQRLIMTHLLEKSHVGVLTGSKLTDVRITVINGRAHQKHTEGGDFRQATYRAVRQGLMQAETILLEPYYNFVIDVPAEMIGKVMTDIDNMFGKVLEPRIEDDWAYLSGYGPVYTLRNYQKNLDAYTHGKGSMYVTVRGYEPCHNQEEIVETMGYKPDEDLRNPSASVFCAHGSGYLVPWYEVFDNMHVQDENEKTSIDDFTCPKGNAFDYSIDLEEIDQILSRTFLANRKKEKHPYQKKKTELPSYSHVKSISPKDKLLIVDGYNVVFAWDELKTLAEQNIDSAKDRLIQILSNYRGIIDKNILLVFDGYKRKGNSGSTVVQENITVVHTKEDVTADQYIEKFSHENRNKYSITVATSDGMIQQIVRGANGNIVSSRELLLQIEAAAKELRETYDIETI